jgi:peptide/nickel transport system substrate-binding protein
MFKLVLVALANVALVSGGANAQPKVVRAVMHSDLKILDPIWTPAYIGRTCGGDRHARSARPVLSADRLPL